MRGMNGEFDPRKKWMSVFCDEPIKLTFNFINQFTDFTIDPAKVTWCVEYRNFLTNQIETVEVGAGQELCLTAEQAKAIYQHAKAIDGGPPGNTSVVVTVSAKFTRDYADGTSRSGKTDQQIILTNTTRAQNNAVFGALPR